MLPHPDADGQAAVVKERERVRTAAEEHLEGKFHTFGCRAPSNSPGGQGRRGPRVITSDRAVITEELPSRG
jgi:hypothetical protein